MAKTVNWKTSSRKDSGIAIKVIKSSTFFILSLTWFALLSQQYYLVTSSTTTIIIKVFSLKTFYNIIHTCRTFKP